MALILNIETSTRVCSVCLARDSQLIALKEDYTGNLHASHLTIFIEQLLLETNIRPDKIDAIAVSKGPGSYTGLRIGVSVAKGLTYGSDLPLIAVCSLQAMVNGLLQKYGTIIEKTDTSLFGPMIDARRMEVFTAFYDRDLRIKRDINADIIESRSYKEFLDKQKIIFFGPGADKCKDTIVHHNANFIENFDLSSEFMISLSYKAFLNKNFVDVAYFEPFYLKDFVATIAKNKVLR